LLFGDGAITPAVSVLSAVEGLASVNADWGVYSLPLAICRVPDDWLLHNRRALLFGRDDLKAVMAAFTPGSQAA
jgi:hypothetical protein